MVKLNFKSPSNYIAELKSVLKNRGSLLREGMWVFVGQITTVIVGLTTLRVVTELIPPNVFGEASLWLGIVALLRNVFISPISNFQIRFYPKFKTQNYLQYFNSVILNYYKNAFVYSIIVFIVTIYILILFKVIIIPVFFPLALILYYFSDILKSNYLNKLSAERKQFLFAIWTIVDAVLIFILIVIGLSVEGTSFSYIASQALGILLVTLVFIPVTKKSLTISESFQGQYSGNIFSEFKKYGLPFIPMAVIVWLLTLGNRYILTLYGSLLQVGIFTAAFSIASRPFIFFSGITAIFFRPILFQAESEKNTIKAKSIIQVWFAVIIVISIFILIFLGFGGNLIAEIFLAKNYHSNLTVLFITIGSGFLFQSIFQVIENRFFSFEKSKLVLYCNIISAIAFLISNIYFISNYGMVGAGIAIAVTYLAQLLIGLYFLRAQKYSK